MNTKFKEYQQSLTPEQRILLLDKAREARAVKATLREANKHLIKAEYLDIGYWASLASDKSVRMPNKDDATSVSVVRKYLKKCGVSIDTFNEHYTGTSYFVKNNPKWSAYATAGIILELSIL